MKGFESLRDAIRWLKHQKVSDPVMVRIKRRRRMYVCSYCGMESEYPLKDHKCYQSERHSNGETGEERVKRRIEEEEAGG